MVKGFQKGHKPTQEEIERRRKTWKERYGDGKAPWLFQKGRKPWFKNKDYTPDKAPNFKGGKQAMFKIVLAKYPYCQKCGNKDLRVLQVHHKDGSYEKRGLTEKGNKYYQKQNLENLIVLCANCHIIIHLEK